jgi:DMSO/TMAO reductase YedYZ molybdopterin-dependent catalytic subunit
MRNSRAIALAALLSLGAGGAALSGQAKSTTGAGVVLDVAGEVSKPRKWTAEDLAKLPRQRFHAKDHGGRESEFEGVPLVEILKASGVPFGSDLRGPALASYLVVEAADGYRAVFALPELDPDFTDHIVLLADRRDGKPLAGEEGPLRLVVLGEKRHARWVRKVVALKLGRA